jgi:hypothetical protein
MRRSRKKKSSSKPLKLSKHPLKGPPLNPITRGLTIDCHTSQLVITDQWVLVKILQKLDSVE